MPIFRQLSATLLATNSSEYMTATTQLALKALLRGLSWLLFAIAGVSFWVGGKAISEFAKTDRILAEFLGLLIAVATGALGYILKNAADALNSSQDSPGQ
jgi:hypothetical protein